MTTDHAHTDMIDEAATWLAQNWEAAHQRSLIKLVRERFGLSIPEASLAIVQARTLRAGRAS